MIVYTSITWNYLPKARVLAASVKEHHPEALFVCVISDDYAPDVETRLGISLETAPIDRIVHSRDLGIESFLSFAFRHRVVELCTAVKGPAAREFLSWDEGDVVIYMDPDTAAFRPLVPILDGLKSDSIVLTPHQTVPETDPRAVVDNEICSLKHGVFNLGFLALKASDAGRRFADWWAERLYDYCYDDIPAGLFTDQRWVDLAPCFFAEELCVCRDTSCNVATWNLSNRTVAGSLEKGLTVDGKPLTFYHFSGFDSGAFATMLGVYGKGNETLTTMHAWYMARCETMGQAVYGPIPCAYNTFGNGEVISLAHRLLYRNRKDLQQAFPDPYATGDPGNSYYHWFEANAGEDAKAACSSGSALESAYWATKAELESIRNSRAYRLALSIKKIKNALTGRRG